jgi:hypothetical protein
VTLATIAPSGLTPSKISTVTGVASLAVPENDGAVSFERGDGPVSVTTGDKVSTANVTALLTQVDWPIELVCEATAV